MEFILEKPVKECLPEKIGFNYEDLKKGIETSIEKYQNLVVTADDIKGAKQDRADLNKLRTSLDTERKRIKKAYNAPYASFEKQVKELIGLIDAPIENIDRQLKVYEEKRKVEKKAQIEASFRARVNDAKLSEFVSLDKIFDPRWLNATYPLAKVQDEIESRLNDIRGDLLLIPDICPDDVDFAKDIYFKTLDIRKTKKDYQDHMETIKRIRERREAEERKAAEEKAAAEQEQIKASLTPDNSNETARNNDFKRSSIEDIQNQEKDVKRVPYVDFRVYNVSAKELGMLRKFLLENNIKYGRVPNNDK